jgi:glycosyltransferase involved in cell wall biosynthesis
VVVPVSNGADLIERCLDALGQQRGMAPAGYEIVVVDDGSTDATPQRVEAWAAAHPRHRVHLVQQANAGPGVARNTGVAAAKSDIVLFTDADCAPVAGWMAAMLGAFADPAVAGVKGTYLSDQRNLVPRFVQAEYEDRYRRMARLPSIDFIDTYSAGYRRAVFLEVGGFDPIFRRPSVEDQELSFRLARHGYVMKFVAEGKVVHFHDADLGEYARRKYGIGYWKALLTRIHPDRIVADSHTPQTLKLQMGLVALAIGLLPLTIIGWWLRPLAWAGWLLGAVAALFLGSAAPFLSALARRSTDLALIGPLMLVMRAGALGFGYLIGTLRWARSPLAERRR